MRLSKDITTPELMQLDYRYHYSDQELLDDWNRLCRTNHFKTGSQFRPGMRLCQHFFPNFWHIKNHRGLSFADAWQDPEIMDRVRCWGLNGMSQLWMSWIRRAVFLTAGLCNSSFYRPHFAREIIMMRSQTPGTLFDPCAGWGGRLLGTVSMGWHYVACEPNPETFDNLQRMVDFLEIQSMVSLYPIPAEKFDYTVLPKVDVVLTSPPYFDLEIYSDNPTQSYHSHNTWDSWRDGWLKPLINQCQDLIKPNGFSCWNVMKVNKFDLTQVVQDAHDPRLWQHRANVGFNSPLANIRKLRNKDITWVYEKI